MEFWGILLLFNIWGPGSVYRVTNSFSKSCTHIFTVQFQNTAIMDWPEPQVICGPAPFSRHQFPNSQEDQFLKARSLLAFLIPALPACKIKNPLASFRILEQLLQTPSPSPILPKDKQRKIEIETNKKSLTPPKPLQPLLESLETHGTKTLRMAKKTQSFFDELLERNQRRTKSKTPFWVSTSTEK